MVGIESRLVLLDTYPMYVLLEPSTTNCIRVLCSMNARRVVLPFLYHPQLLPTLYARTINRL